MCLPVISLRAMRYHEMYNKSSKSQIVIHGSGLEMYTKSSKSQIVIHGIGLGMHNKSSKSRIVIHGRGLEMHNKSSKSRNDIHSNSLDMYKKSSKSWIVIHGSVQEVPPAIHTHPFKIIYSIKYPALATYQFTSPLLSAQP